MAKLGKRGKDKHINSITIIDEYNEWRIKSEDFFCDFFEESNSSYKRFVNFPTDGNGYTLMNYFNQQ